jgi:hypothetical protein
VIPQPFEHFELEVHLEVASVIKLVKELDRFIQKLLEYL